MRHTGFPAGRRTLNVLVVCLIIQQPHPQNPGINAFKIHAFGWGSIGINLFDY
jgi:hypothetical protein